MNSLVTSEMVMFSLKSQLTSKTGSLEFISHDLLVNRAENVLLDLDILAQLGGNVTHFSSE